MTFKITRAELQTLTDDQRLLRHLERLFDLAGDELPANIESATVNGANAAVMAAQALDAITILARTAGSLPPSIDIQNLVGRITALAVMPLVSNADIQNLVGRITALAAAPPPSLPDFSGSRLTARELALTFVNTATVGSVTIDNSSGRVIMPATGVTLTLTNALIVPDSRVMLTFAGNPGVTTSLFAIASTGSCTINTTAALVNQTPIDFLIIN